MKLRIGNDAIFKTAFLDENGTLIETSSIKQIQAWFVPKRKSSNCIVNRTRINEMYNDLCYSYLPTANGRFSAPGECIIDGNDIYICFRAKDQKRVGLYGLVITFTINCNNMAIQERTYTVESCCDVDLCSCCGCGCNCSTEGVFTSDITVSLADGKTFGKYLNGDVVPAKGKTARQVIEDALNETSSTIPTITNFALPEINTQQTVGTNISAGNYQVTFNTTNGNNITEIKLYDVTNNALIGDISNTTSPATISLPYVASKANGGTQIYKLTAVYSTGTTDSNNYVITWSGQDPTPVISTFSLTNISNTTTSATISGNTTLTYTGTNLDKADSIELKYRLSGTTTDVIIDANAITGKTELLGTISLPIVGSSVTFTLSAIKNSIAVSSKTITCTRVTPPTPTLGAVSLSKAQVPIGETNTNITATVTTTDYSYLNNNITILYNLNGTGYQQLKVVTKSSDSTYTFVLPTTDSSGSTITYNIGDNIKIKFVGTSTIDSSTIESKEASIVISAGSNYVYYKGSKDAVTTATDFTGCTKTAVSDTSTVKTFDSTGVATYNKFILYYPATMTLDTITQHGIPSNKMYNSADVNENTNSEVSVTINNVVYKIHTLKVLLSTASFGFELDTTFK